MMPTFVKQFTGKSMWVIFGSLITLDLLSFLTLHTSVETVLFTASLILLVFIANKSPEWLFPIAMAEIIATSNGHSFNTVLFGVSVGLRIAIFAVLVIASGIKLVRKRENPIPHRYRIVSILLVAVVIYGAILGLLNGNGMRNLYLDANGYLAIGYIFAAWIWVRNADSRRQLFQAVGAGILWIAIKTLLFLFMFGHLHPKTLDPIYKWIRDTRLGEVTLQGGNIYRIFLQSQWFLVPAMLTTAAYIWLAERSRETGVRVLFMITFAAILASLSRSFWVALVVTVPILAVAVLRWSGWKKFVNKIPDFAAVKIGTVAMLWVIIAIPIYQSTNFSFFSDLFSGRATGVSDVAIDSRQSLLTPMIDAVIDSPATGYGLGSTLTYNTSDPRWIDDHETNIVETYAFEWGWLDIWIKFGILGVFALLWLAFLITQDLWQLFRIDKPRRWLHLSLLLSLIGIYVVHFFSPYLNHPIGWGTIAIIIALIPFEDRRLEAVRVKEPVQARRRKRAGVIARKAD
ncbi:O-antigen ligase family protein [Candidatus Uhrbacteria bacterium]|nr:O-antigen ligase family protein [Candidatus Uhrbacteria bacterium]